jgi:hypothetical protein
VRLDERGRRFELREGWAPVRDAGPVNRWSGDPPLGIELSPAARVPELWLLLAFTVWIVLNDGANVPPGSVF